MLRVVIEEHAHEASVLSTLRELSVRAPDRSLDDLRILDERVEAHLDGLRIGGPGAARLCQRAVDEGGPEQLFVAGVLGFESAQPSRIEPLLDAICAAAPFARAASSALAWLALGQAEALLRELALARVPALRLVALAGAAAHRVDPGTPLRAALVASEVALRARALRAVGELGLSRLVPELLAGLEDEAPACRFAAASSAALLGAHEAAAPVLCELARSGEPSAEDACRAAALCLSFEHGRAWIDELRRAGAARLAAIAAGSLGDVRLVPLLVEWTDEPQIARVSAEAITSLTGLRPSGELARGAPAGSRHGPTENAEDDDVAPDPDEGLAWPDPARLAVACARFPRELGSEPCLLGRPRTDAWLLEVLRHGRQRERALAARARAMGAPGAPLFEVRARAERQLRVLRAAGGG